MGGFGFIAWIIIGIVAGWLAEKIMKRDHGLLTNLIVGVVGALIGGFLANNLLGVDAAGNWIVGIIVATTGNRRSTPAAWFVPRATAAANEKGPTGIPAGPFDEGNATLSGACPSSSSRLSCGATSAGASC